MAVFSESQVEVDANVENGCIEESGQQVVLGAGERRVVAAGTERDGVVGIRRRDVLARPAKAERGLVVHGHFSEHGDEQHLAAGLIELLDHLQDRRRVLRRGEHHQRILTPHRHDANLGDEVG
jgi:hypothetical protein